MRDTPPGIFFTGTDTSVGKTYIVAAVARTLRAQGRPVCVSKPVASGARLVSGRLLSDDTIALAEASGQSEELDRVTPFVFEEPLAPSVAARRQRRRLTVEDLVGAVDRARVPGVPLLVEGIGGLLCPLTDRDTVADLAAALRMPIVIVARRSLGTLNHTLLTIEAAQSRSLDIAGLIINEDVPATDLAAETNVAEIRRRTDVPVLAVVPNTPEPGVPRALTAVDWWSLCGMKTALPAKEHVC
jgi:dethiobiotin synthetase